MPDLNNQTQIIGGINTKNNLPGAIDANNLQVVPCVNPHSGSNFT